MFTETPLTGDSKTTFSRATMDIVLRIVIRFSRVEKMYLWNYVLLSVGFKKWTYVREIPHNAPGQEEMPISIEKFIE